MRESCAAAIREPHVILISDLEYCGFANTRGTRQQHPDDASSILGAVHVQGMQFIHRPFDPWGRACTRHAVHTQAIRSLGQCMYKACSSYTSHSILGAGHVLVLGPRRRLMRRSGLQLALGIRIRVGLKLRVGVRVIIRVLPCPSYSGSTRVGYWGLRALACTAISDGG